MGIDPQPGWISGGDKPKEPRFNDPKRGKRLQTVMADAGVASRRACETLIEEGAVEVNGITVR
ncbi:MAG: S4 domain-containing protein, partial [Planctomycetota bacterium]|nr:S4 domain-containing protein [Planctomycetota bacterium]